MNPILIGKLPAKIIMKVALYEISVNTLIIHKDDYKLHQCTPEPPSLYVETMFFSWLICNQLRIGEVWWLSLAVTLPIFPFLHYI